MHLFPYMPNHKDSVGVESHVLLYSVAGVGHLALDAVQHYPMVRYHALLTTLWQLGDPKNLDIVYDKTSDSLADERQIALQALLSCYPGTTLEKSTRFFDVYRMDTATVSAPVCYSPPAPTITSPPDAGTVNAGQSVTLTRDSGESAASSFIVTLDQELSGMNWIEGEDVFKGSGWTVHAEYLNDFNGAGFMIDDWQSGEAVASVTLPSEAHYRVWVRSYKRRENDQRIFPHLAGKDLEFAEAGSPLEQWTWKDLGVVDLAAGEYTISLTRVYGIDPQCSIFFDTFVLAADLDFVPGSDNGWKTVLSTPEVRSAAAQSPLSTTLPPGEYRWKVSIFNGNKFVDRNGEHGVESKTAIFEVLP
jgi:hypothetical protein